VTEYTEEFKKYIFDCITGLSDVLFLDTYDFRVVFKDDPDISDRLLYADIGVDTLYLESEMSIYPGSFAIWQDGDRERVAHIVLHELCHVHTEDLYSWGRSDLRQSQEADVSKSNEVLVERLSRIVSGLLPDRWWDSVHIGFNRREYVKVREKSKDSCEVLKEQELGRDNRSIRR
jgi:hypothetical protein